MEPRNAAVIMNFTDTSPNRKVAKRRSSIFQRRSIVPKQDLDNADFTEDANHEAKKLKLQNENELKSSMIKTYMEILQNEDRSWREEYVKRKLQTHELSKRDKNQLLNEQTMDITSLLDAERAFLADKPDYLEFNKNLVQLHAMATKVAFLNKSAEHFYERTISKLQDETDNALHRIMNLIV